MFIRTLLTLALLLAAAAATAQVYKWIDEDGIVHYSDQPIEGAERIDLPKRRATPPVRGIAPPPRPAAASSSANAAPAAFSYETLQFTSPNAEQTLWNIGGVLTVSIRLQPQLRTGDRLRVYFDGEPQQVSSREFQLQEVWRGTHNLQAEVLDANGTLMIRSEPLRFYVQQTSVANP